MKIVGVVRNTVNDQLLRLSYGEAKNIRNLLSNWGGLESLSRKGDTVAICILVDLKEVTGINPEKYNRHNRDEFNRGYLNGKLSKYQYMCIVYTLVLGYSQLEVAYVMGVDQSVVSKNVYNGIKRIQRELNALLEDE